MYHGPVKSVYKTVGLTARSGLDDRDGTIEKIASIIVKTGATLLLDKKRCALPSLKKYKSFSSVKGLDLLIVIGGDGTILRAIRETDDFSIPILSVNRGTVGFLAETSLEEADTLLPFLLSGKGQIEERSLLKVIVERGKKKLWSGYVLNEAVIAQGAIARLIDIRVLVNKEELATFHADGVIVATPTGSTAYSLSAGGPIVHPRLQSVIVTPINPHSFTQKPIVLPCDTPVRMEVIARKNKFKDTQVSLTLDGQTYLSLKGGDTVTTTMDGTTVKFVRRNEDTFFSTLRSKLKWAERIEE